MKQFYTLTVLLLFQSTVQAQVILNEIYPIPGNNRQEFFELYNMSGSNTPVSLDNYTLVTYFEEGNKKGFYVLDLPNQTVAPRRYYVGSAANPFSFQGVTNSTSTNFSWNDLSFLSVRNGYLRKWVLGNLDATDGNIDYDLDIVPSNFNDLFTKTGGNGASYSVFLYSSGTLINAFFGGTGGNMNIPGFITAMPALRVDIAGSAADFDINFSGYTYKNTPSEFLTNDVGTDNGYIRIRDGVCGSWEKSSAGVQHSPGKSNGGQVATTGVISVETAIIRGTAATGSKINYDAVGAPITVFPITLMIYVDNGTVSGQLDSGDTFIESNIENTLSDGGFTTTFFPFNSNVLIVVNTAQGCVDKVLFVPNIGVLPVKLLSFENKKENSNEVLIWKVDQNETANQFELQKSSDRKDFKTVSLIKATDKKGMETYTSEEISDQASTVYYRLKIYNNNQSTFYSDIIYVSAQSPNNKNIIRLYQNPVSSNLSFSYTSVTTGTAKVSVYNALGIKVLATEFNVQTGTSTANLAADQIMPGTYVLEIVKGMDHSTAMFVKY
ncbi:MAG: lamin tail domain-containing protein [Flavisolibacter sp.]|nr:lamin tail domain-containing protein [Flavisolibacter sp.]